MFTKEQIEFLIFAVDELHHESIGDMEYEIVCEEVSQILEKEADRLGVKIPDHWDIKGWI